ncbi:MAG: hypothetical protein IPP66_00605 [Anaerolineales bacterium]|nr:hypothetical protein [Anaerolineales bacterium]
MTCIIVSTNHRHVLHGEVSGWLYVIDLETHQILQATAGIEPPYRIRDTNPRGGMRGMRGMSFNNGEFAIANYSTVFFFDHHWNLVRAITHPSVSAIHEIMYVDDGVWITSTANDLLAKFDLSGALKDCYLVREQKKMLKSLDGITKQKLHSRDILNPKTDFRRRPYFNSDVYDRTHLNSIVAGPHGDLLLSLGLIVGNQFSWLMTVKTLMLKLKIWDFFLTLNRMLRYVLRLRKQLHSELIVPPAKSKSAVVRFNQSDTWEIVLKFTTAHNPSHSICSLHDGSFIYLDTSSGIVIHFSQDGNVFSSTQITEKFLRGALELPDGRLALGASNTLLIFNLANQKIVDAIELSTEPSNTIFDIKLFPSGFDLPPDNLETATGRMLGFDGEKIIWEGNTSANSGSHS